MMQVFDAQGSVSERVRYRGYARRAARGRRDTHESLICSKYEHGVECCLGGVEGRREGREGGGREGGGSRVECALLLKFLSSRHPLSPSPSSPLALCWYFLLCNIVVHTPPSLPMSLSRPIPPPPPPPALPFPVENRFFSSRHCGNAKVCGQTSTVIHA